MDAAELGRYGEDLAAEVLTSAGMTVLARNWRCSDGELDLVLRDVDGTLVFVSVSKTRGTGRGPAALRAGRVSRWTAAMGCMRPGAVHSRPTGCRGQRGRLRR